MRIPLRGLTIDEELLLEHYPNERAEALDHLDFAIQEFEAMKMAASLERALALKASLA